MRTSEMKDHSAAFQSLWNQMQQNAKETGAGPDNVEDAVRAVREESRAEESRSEPAEGQE